MNLLSLPGIEPRLLRLPAHNLASIPTTLSQLPIKFVSLLPIFLTYFTCPLMTVLYRHRLESNRQFLQDCHFYFTLYKSITLNYFRILPSSVFIQLFCTHYCGTSVKPASQIECPPNFYKGLQEIKQDGFRRAPAAYYPYQIS